MANTASESNDNKNEVIELLRFIAAFSVFFVHVPQIGVGHWGVDIFFVISGFVMMLSTAKGGEHFFVKRLIRIVPTYYLLTFGVFFVALISPKLLGNTTANPAHLLFSLLFVPFDKNGAGHSPVLFLGWTLNFEMMFYLLFAMAMSLSFQFRGVLAAVAVLTVFGIGKFAVEYPLVAYSDSIILEFILGIAIYYALIERRLLLTVLLLIIYAIPLGTGLVGTDARGYAVGLYAATFCLIALVALRGVPIHRFFVLMGGASYALYLTHPYIIQAVNRIFGRHVFGMVGTSAAIGVSVLLSFLVAVIFYKVVEVPARRNLRGIFLSR